MSVPFYITINTNGDIWVGGDVNAKPTSGTILKQFRVNSDCSLQKITTLTGSGNSSSSALSATNGATTRHGKSSLDTDDFS